jgi:hypothetical protein
LNNCFARLNSDTNNLRTIFKPVAGATKIRFILDQVKRVSTTQSSFIYDFNWWTGQNYADDVKITANGGSNAISPDKKLNIWVCDLELPGGTEDMLGYAYPPPGLSNWPAGSSYPSLALDGVVIDYRAFGGQGKNPLDYAYGMRGKTAVHEVAHYLGLRHIWGDDDGACPGQLDYEDDGISDTPPQADKTNFNCNKNLNTCTTTSDMPDMVENYMDYSSESCQNTFTKGQAALMEYVIDNVRTGIRVPVATENVLSDKNISIYPNPAKDNVTFQLFNIDFKQADIQFINSHGQVVYAKSILNEHSDNFTTVQVNQLAPGMYAVKVVVDNNQVGVFKVMITP